VDELRDPLAGAPVEGTARTVFTDNDGEFEVTLPQGSLSHWEIPVSCIFGLFATVPAASAGFSFDAEDSAVI
jgi:hypothetical protein